MTARTPGINETKVKRGINVTATFSEAVTGTTGPGNFTLRRTSNGARVSATVTYDAATKVATLNPNGNLRSNERYTVNISNRVKDTAGNTLNPVSWRFRTGNSV